jgi:hypothetical protein
MTAATIGVILYPKPIDDTRYLAANIDKTEYLSTARSPKIIFIGGSTAAFALDSEKIQRKIGMPVVNMGLAAGLGLRYNLEQIKEHIASGDIIVVIPEYDLFYSEFDGDGSVLLEAYLLLPEAKEHIASLMQYVRLLRGMPHLVNRRGKWYIRSLVRFMQSKPQSTTVYHRYAFNKYGDMVSHLDKKSEDILKLELSQRTIESDFQERAISMLNQFNGYAKRRGAKVLFIFPSILDVFYKRNKKKIEFLAHSLKVDSDIRVLNSPQQCVFPVRYFFNTEYHLNAEGRKIYTEKVLRVLSRL